MCLVALRCKVLGLGLSLPLPPALVGAGVGVFFSELVGVSAARLVGLKGLPVGGPLDVVVVSDGLLQPLLEVVLPALPAKDIGKVVAAALGQLDKEARIGRVHRGGVRGDNWDRLYRRLVC